MSEVICKHCDKPVVFHPKIKLECCQWIHADGFYNCDGRRGHASTYAEPKGVTDE